MSGLKTGFAVSCVLLVLILGVKGSALAEIPKKINYQGRVTDSVTGEPLVGPQNMTFHIYDDPGTGSLLWSESQTMSADSAGIISAILGTITPIDISFDGPVWLEVEVDGETLSPRREIVSVPFAFRAGEAEHSASADSLGGLSSESYSLVGHTHDEYVEKDELGSITGDMITDGEITDNDVAPGAGIDPGKIAGTAWTSNNDGTGSGLDADMVDGLHADAFADTGHNHNALYFSKDELHSPGELNNPDNPVHWTKLTDVPDGFADGIDDAGAGDGHSLDAADGDPIDAVYVDSDGNVGIGSTTPAANLDVNGEINTGMAYEIGQEAVLSVPGESNVFVGVAAGAGNTGTFGAFVGDSAGYNNEGMYNTFLGHSAGFSNLGGTVNTFIGSNAGRSNTNATDNTFVGAFAGPNNVSGHNNTFMGGNAGGLNYLGSHNTFLGSGAGFYNYMGHQNTFMGAYAGFNSTGSGNVFIGYEAGYSETDSDNLYIANGPDDSDVLIYGDFSTGRIGLGTTSPDKRLHVTSPTSNFGMVMLENSNTGDNEASIGFKEGSDADGSEIWVAGVGGWGNTNDFVIGRAAAKLLVTPAGNLGVGTVNPQAKVDANTGTGVGVKGRSEDDDGVVGRTEVAGKSGVFGHSDDGYGVTGRSDNTFGVAAVGGGDDSGYDNVGDLLLGGTYGEIFSFGTLLNIYTNGSCTLFLDHDNNGTERFSIWKGDGGDVFSIEEDGDMWLWGRAGIGTINPGYKLQVGEHGDGTEGRANAWTTFSSREYKKDIRPLEHADYRRVLEELNQTDIVSYRFSQDPKETEHIGVIAEDAPPEIVTPDGKAVNLTDYSAFLLAAIKAQQDQIEDLRIQVQELRAQLGNRE